MGSGLRVGDLVLIMGSECTSDRGRAFIGTTATVECVKIATDEMSLPGEQYCVLSPRCGTNIGWYSRSLKRIDPPAEYDGNSASSWKSVVVWEPKRAPNKVKEGV